MRTVAVAAVLLIAAAATVVIACVFAAWQPPPVPQEDDLLPGAAPEEAFLSAPPAPPSAPAWEPVTPRRTASAAPWDDGTVTDTAWRKDQADALSRALAGTAPTSDLWPMTPAAQDGRPWELKTGEWPELMKAMETRDEWWLQP